MNDAQFAKIEDIYEDILATLKKIEEKLQGWEK